MKRFAAFLTLGFLCHPIALAAFDKTAPAVCNFTITCPNGQQKTIMDEYDVCVSGWGLCFSHEECGQNVDLTIQCGNVGGIDPDNPNPDNPEGCDANPLGEGCTDQFPAV